MEYILAISCLLAACMVATATVQSEMVKLHNNVRAKHQVGPVKSNCKLAATAVKCAKYYAKKNTIDHTCPEAENYGENLGQDGSYQDDEESAKMIFDLWYNENKKYNYKNPDSVPFEDYGHFSQVVWKGTNEIGCGVAINKKSKQSFVCCLYNPPGNYDGEYKENVFPRK